VLATVSYVRFLGIRLHVSLEEFVLFVLLLSLICLCIRVVGLHVRSCLPLLCDSSFILVSVLCSSQVVSFADVSYCFFSPWGTFVHCKFTAPCL
jgi:hypothetical protein